MIAIGNRPYVRHVAQTSCWVVLFVLLFLCSANGQSSYPTDGSTPMGLKPGAPAGSYALSGFENVNLNNGSLNFRLPLMGIGGRGGAAHTIVLPIEQKWQVESYTIQMDDYTETHYYPDSDWWEVDGPRYGLGVMHIRYGGWLKRNCYQPYQPPRYQNTLTRLTFTTPDGTEYEFRDQLTGGAKYTVPVCGTSAQNRGKVWVSADGTATTFISDSDIFDLLYYDSGGGGPSMEVSGYLILRDGTRYRIDNGYVSSMRDRNGNKLSFANSVFTDSLNRQVTIECNVQDVAPYGLCDRITFKGFGGAARILRISKTGMSNALRSDYSLQTLAQLFPNLEGSSYDYFNPTIVSDVWLPDGQRYQFRYNSYGELARVVLPTGGAVEYDHGPGLASGSDVGGTIGNVGNWAIYRRVLERREYADGINLTNKMIYGRYVIDSLWTGYVVVDKLNASGALLGRQKHYFHGPDPGEHVLLQNPVKYPAWDEGREYQTDVFDTNGTTVLRRVNHTWQGNGTMGGMTVNARVVETTTTIEPSGANLVSKQTLAHDQYNNQTDVYEYDYGSGVPGALVRRTHTDYLTTNNVNGVAYDTLNPSSSNPDLAATVHTRSLAAQVSVFDAGGVERARAGSEYDNYATDTNHAALWNRSSISGLDAAFTTSLTTRGNATAMTSYLLVNGAVTGSISAYGQFDIAGNVIKVIDGRGYATTLDFDDCFGAPDNNARVNSAPLELSSPGQASYAFATKVTNALGQTAYGQLDYYLGQSVNGEDANGIVASGYYNDALDRPTQVRRAVGTTAESQTTFSYDDTNRIVTTTSDRTNNNDNLLKSQSLYDNLGRPIESRQYEGGTNYIAVQTQYDSLGRAFRSSNPYRPWQTETAIWTTLSLDALGRTLTTTTSDNAVTTTSYNGNHVTVTDQAGKSRKSVADALGRMTQVYEDPSSLNYVTSYSYDVLDNLTTVTQGAQTRTFAYDSLKRLSSASNPESGSFSYTYDNNSNLLTRTDARSITTTMVYDALNRLTSRTYQNDPSGTPVVNYFYDNQTLPSGAPSYDRGYSIGALVAVTYGGGIAGTYRGYDVMGRVVRQYQRTDSVNYLVEASYSPGFMTGETYPSVPGAGDRRTVTYTPDAAGRPLSLNSNATTYAPAASVSSIGYASHSALKTETYGNALVHAVTYNNRLQPTEIKLGTSGNPTSILSLVYNYGTTNNNGNVQSVTYNGGGLSYTQTFGYDQLNRLTTSNENGGASWSQTNGYDRYGNRWIDLGGGSQSLYFNTGNNRISGWSYDSAGNLLNDSVHAYTYDAENKTSKVDSVTAYTYDGEGQRVKKLVGENTRFVYGIGGQLIAEFDGSSGNLKKEYVIGGATLITIEPTAVNSNGTQYTAPDNLGSPRVITKAGGLVVSRHDYMPFGEELGASIGGRTTGMGFSNGGDNNRKKFTQKERDNETGLDYFLARYFSSTQGRFTSPDEFKGGPDQLYVLGSGDEEKQALPYAEIANPQSLNKYTYVYNNPLRFIDPDGHQGDDPITRLLRWFARQLDPQQEAEQPRRGPLSLDADKVNAQASQEMAKEGLRTMETLEKFGLDGNVTDMARQMDKKNYVGTAMAAAFMAFNVVTLGRGGALEKQAGEQLSKRFIVTEGKTVAGGVKMADWLAAARDGSRGIAMEVFTGTNKSISTVRKQLENGMAYLNSKGVKNVVPYVMVNSKRAATRVQKDLGKVRGHTVKIIIGP